MNNYKKLAWAIIIVGISLRSIQYLYNRSLWLDEAMLALNIVNKNFLELFFPLDYGIGAPIGFLLIQKSIICLLGNHDFILRLFPFLCSLSSLILFFRVAQGFIKPQVIPIALSFFCFSDSLLYYATESKQYSCDVTLTLLIILTVIHVISGGYSLSKILIMAALSNIAIWISSPCLFIVAGTNIVLLWNVLKGEGNKQTIYWLLFLFFLEMINFLILYLITLKPLLAPTHPFIPKVWDFAFMPFPPWSLANFKWFILNFFRIFKYPGCLVLNHLSALVFIIGCLAMAKEKKDYLLLLIIPILLTLLASGLHLYPFADRLILFIVPILFIFISKGIEKIFERSSIIGITLAGALLCYSILSATRYLIVPRTKEEIKPVMIYLQKNKHPKDVVILHNDAKYSFQYYAKQYDFQKPQYIVGDDKNLNKFQGQNRIWIIFSHFDSNGYNERDFTLSYLDKFGKKLDSFLQPGTELYLYDLS